MFMCITLLARYGAFMKVEHLQNEGLGIFMAISDEALSGD